MPKTATIKLPKVAIIKKLKKLKIAVFGNSINGDL